jgi:hypothetical protein
MISLLVLNRGLLSLLLLSDILLIVLFFCSLIVGSFYNIYYMFGLGLFMLVCGGVELILNFLVLFV